MKEEHSVSEQSYERSLNCCVCKISEANMGKKHSAEHCAKLSEAKMGKKRSAATFAKMMGKKRSAATRAKISEALKGAKRSAATRAKMSKAKKGKKHYIVFPSLYLFVAKICDRRAFLCKA